MLTNAPSENEHDIAEMAVSRPAARLLKLLRPGGYSTWLIYLLLVVLFFLGVGIVSRFSQALNAQQQNLRYRHQEALLGLEAEMKSALNTVEGLRTAAQAYYTNPGAEPSPYYGMLAPRPDKEGYALEHIQPPFSQDRLANLTGLGKLERGDTSFRREIEMSLALTPLFEWAKSTHPAAPWVYYTSARDFISIYPWVSADDFFFSPALYEHGFFSDGLPENNPDRRSFITEVYKDEAGQGLMVTIAAPVYEGDTFRGTVALDFTLAWLHQFFTQAQYTEEKAFIVNDLGQIVALSTVTTTEKVLGVADVLPELKQDVATLLNLTPGQVHTLGQYYVFVQPIQHTPWTYIAAVRWPYIVFDAATEVVPVILMFVLFMAAVVFMWQRAWQGSKLRALEAHHIAQEQQAQAERARLQQEIIEAQQQAIAELSTPVIPIMDRIIVMPLIGSIDSMRARDITRNLLTGISQHRAKVVILDVTGVGLMDTGIVNHLNKTIQAARLKGAQTIVTGVSDAVAEAIVDLGIDWSSVTTLSDLQTGLMAALNRLGFGLAKKNGSLMSEEW